MEAAVRGEAMHAEYAALNVQVAAKWSRLVKLSETREDPRVLVALVK